MQINSITIMFICIAILMVLIILLFIMNLSNSSKINAIMDYSDDGDIITALSDYYKKIKDISKTINDKSDAVLISRLENSESEAHLSIKKVGIVNFDAFDDVKGNMSFSLALLNSNNDGLILTSLYGHNSCNTYIREITMGETTVKLLDEEKLALEKAKNQIKKANE